MSVSRYFGLPGCGKTTTLTMLAYKGLTCGKYKHVYGNVQLGLPGYTYIPFDVLGKYQLDHCLVLIDEAMVECGDRDHKSFGKEKLELFVMHRHYKMDIVLFSQEADGVDKKVRSVSADMYYVKKGWLLGRWTSNIYKIPYGIVWPGQTDNGENLGKIVMGYTKPSIICRLLARRLWRPRWYRYFDSWEARGLAPLPSEFKPYPGKPLRDPWVLKWGYKTLILLRWYKGYKKGQKRSLRRLRLSDRCASKRSLDQAALSRLDSVGVYDVPSAFKIS